MRNPFKRYKNSEPTSTAEVDTQPRGIHHTVRVETSYNETWKHIWGEIRNIGISADSEKNFKSEEIYSYDVLKVGQQTTDYNEQVEIFADVLYCNQPKRVSVEPQLLADSKNWSELKEAQTDCHQELNDNIISAVDSSLGYARKTVDYAIAASVQNDSTTQTSTTDQMVFNGDLPLITIVKDKSSDVSMKDSHHATTSGNERAGEDNYVSGGTSQKSYDAEGEGRSIMGPLRSAKPALSHYVVDSQSLKKITPFLSSNSLETKRAIKHLSGKAFHSRQKKSISYQAMKDIMGLPNIKRSDIYGQLAAVHG